MKIWIAIILLAVISIGATFGITRHFYQKQVTATVTATQLTLSLLGQHINKVCRLPNT
jgi:flagellar basal body-associated protein FliL